MPQSRVETGDGQRLMWPELGNPQAQLQRAPALLLRHTWCSPMASIQRKRRVADITKHGVQHAVMLLRCVRCSTRTYPLNPRLQGEEPVYPPQVLPYDSSLHMCALPRSPLPPPSYLHG